MSKAKTTTCNCSDTRRTFLKTAGLAGLSFTGLPQIASAITRDDYQEKEILKTRALQNGKAQRITLLHTADIHSQLDTHDEFFWEGNQPVYKKRGGFAVLQTMLQTIKSQNPGNTLIID